MNDSAAFLLRAVLLLVVVPLCPFGQTLPPADRYQLQSRSRREGTCCISKRWTTCTSIVSWNVCGDDPSTGKSEDEGCFWGWDRYECGAQCSCTPCPPGTYETKPPGKWNDRECRRLFVCAAGQYVSNAPTSTTDRGCASCAEGTYTDRPNLDACLPQTTCNAGEYISTYESKDAARVCIQCPDGHYQPEQNHQITKCLVQPRCAKGERYVVDTRQKFKAAADCIGCSFGGFMAAENHANVACIPYAAECDSTKGQTEVASPGPTQDRVCDTSDPCTDFQYEVEAATATSNRQCASITLCTSGQYIEVNKTTSTDRVCKDCDGETVYSETANSIACTKMDTCARGQYVSVQGSRVTNQECNACSNGKYQPSGYHRIGFCNEQPRCGKGTYLEGATLIKSGRCAMCPQGQFSDDDNHRDAACRQQPYCNAAEALKGAGLSSEGVCTTCPQGTEQNQTNHREAECTLIQVSYVQTGCQPNYTDPLEPERIICGLPNFTTASTTTWVNRVDVGGNGGDASGSTGKAGGDGGSAGDGGGGGSIGGGIVALLAIVGVLLVGIVVMGIVWQKRNNQNEVVLQDLVRVAEIRKEQEEAAKKRITTKSTRGISGKAINVAHQLNEMYQSASISAGAGAGAGAGGGGDALPGSHTYEAVDGRTGSEASITHTNAMYTVPSENTGSIGSATVVLAKTKGQESASIVYDTTGTRQSSGSKLPPLNAVTANSDYAGLAEGQYEVTDEDAAGNAGASAYSQLSTVVGPGVVEYAVPASPQITSFDEAAAFAAAAAGDASSARINADALAMAAQLGGGASAGAVVGAVYLGAAADPEGVGGGGASAGAVVGAVYLGAAADPDTGDVHVPHAAEQNVRGGAPAVLANTSV